MNKRKYCTKCLNLADEADLAFYSSLKFRHSNGKIIHGRELCIANKEISYTYSVTPMYKDKQKHIVVDDPYILNKDGSCNYYEHNFFWPISNFFRMFA